MRIEGDSIGIRDPGAGVGSADRPGVPERGPGILTDGFAT
jgi:hypothetical protein